MTTTKARTRGHIARLVIAHGWQVLSSHPGGAYFRRGTTSINLRYSASGQLIQAIRYEPGHNRGTHLVQGQHQPRSEPSRPRGQVRRPGQDAQQPIQLPQVRIR
jgi:hypothetical protein